MVLLDGYIIEVRDIREMLQGVGDAMGLAELKQKQQELAARQSDESFWNDMKQAQSVSRELKQVENKINSYTKLLARLEDIEVLLELIEDSQDDGEIPQLEIDIKKLGGEVEKLRLQTLLRGAYDSYNAILTLHAGAGGTEAQDWADMLYRMYTRYSERNGYKIRILDYQDGDEAGIKSVTFCVEGENAYGYLKAEKGVHRLVRISPFDSQSRRHTSFSSLEVMPEIENDTDVEIDMEEVRVDTYRSGGAGGQHVNKTDSAVRMTHIPTGIVVQCQNERSQMQNREQAMRMLKSKLLEKQERDQLEQFNNMKGELKKIEWGSQIRSYVFCPYTMVKDHRTGEETGNITAVMDGELENFITSYLKKS